MRPFVPAAILGATCIAGLAWIAAGRTPNIAVPSSTTFVEPSHPPIIAGETTAPRPLAMPVSGIDPGTLHESFDEARGGDTRRHGAIDILAPRGTPVVATDDGVVRKIFTSNAGGLTIYEFDPDARYCYYYAHLDGYAAGLHEGQDVHRGDVLGYIGTTGNAPKNTPHLHFAVVRLDPDRRWWGGTPVDPYPLLHHP
jgi:murein DD-endopeptidase MepM/ murein hydrolase activator NlpD